MDINIGPQRSQFEQVGSYSRGIKPPKTSFWKVVDAAAVEQPATPGNTEQKRIDETKALALVPFEALNKPQQYANPGDTMPIVFGREASGAGGIWISPPLLDSSSDDFEQTFVFLLTHDRIKPTYTITEAFLGNRAISDITIAGTLTANNAWTDSSAVCPIASYSPNCNHTNFNYLADALGTSVGDVVRVRTVERYTTGVTIKVKPIYPDGSSSPTLMERYTLTVTRVNNSTAAVSTVGTLTTDATGGITSISDTPTADNYTYSIENTAIHTASAVKPAAILIEFRQSNTFPTSYDRTTSYTNISLLVVEGNLYNLEKDYSEPSELKQLHLYVPDGIYVNKWRFVNNSIATPGGFTVAYDSSNLFCDLIQFWFESSGKFINANIQWFRVYDIGRCSLFLNHYNIRCNIYLTTSTNFISWAQTVSRMFLCSFYSNFGGYGLKPLLPLADDGQIESGPLTVSIAFTDQDLGEDSIQGSIIAGSYQKTYLSTLDRLPIQVVVTWRGQDALNLETQRTTTVRYSDYAADAPEESYDLSQFCTNSDHAIIFAKYILATRRYSQHRVSFQTGRNVFNAFLEPLDVITLSLGRVTSVGDSRTEEETYLVDSLSYDSSGVVAISASHFPVDGAGASIISNSILSGSFVVTT